jgi:two-component system sensor histidine kinase TctE
VGQRDRHVGQRDPQALKKSLQQIARASQRATRMVNQLLSMARADDASQAQNHQDVNLARVATEAVRDFVPRALEKRIDLGYEGPNTGTRHLQGLMVHGQPVLLRELVRNLVDNALQYTPEGGTVTVRVVDDPFGQVVVLQVEDSGPGIPAAERELVFQPFYRALGTNVDGSGLGLAIVREIAARHQVEVTLDDAQPRGRPGTGANGPGALFTLRFQAIASVAPATINAASDIGIAAPLTAAVQPARHPA